MRAAGRHGGAAGRQLDKLRRGGPRRSGARDRAERLCGECALPWRGRIASALAPRPAAAASRPDALAPAVDAPVLEQRHRPVGAGRGGRGAATAQRRHRAGRGQAPRLRAGQEREAERAVTARSPRVDVACNRDCDGVPLSGRDGAHRRRRERGEPRRGGPALKVADAELPVHVGAAAPEHRLAVDEDGEGAAARHVRHSAEVDEARPADVERASVAVAALAVVVGAKGEQLAVRGDDG
mmetsp:Transcript_46391/g.150674  ORF Transcript_46391/g.150674 Transcript_46391/m.150674 type:complete len:239 (+) Transcript_46391:198-914(+)